MAAVVSSLEIEVVGAGPEEVPIIGVAVVVHSSAVVVSCSANKVVGEINLSTLHPWTIYNLKAAMDYLACMLTLINRNPKSFIDRNWSSRMIWVYSYHNDLV